MSWKEEARPDQSERGSLTILVISSLEDFLLLAPMFDRPSFKLLGVRTCRDGCNILRQRFVPVVISDRNLPDGSWRDVLCAAESFEHPSHLVVTTQLADERLWAGKLEGNYVQQFGRRNQA